MNNNQNYRIEGHIVKDSNGNVASFFYWRSKAAAIRSLKTLKNCKNCLNCEECTDCENCATCFSCNNCKNCWNLGYGDNCG